MARTIRAAGTDLDLAPRSRPPHPGPACPWCGSPAIAAEAPRELGFLVCDACSRVSTYDAETPLDGGSEDLEDTDEYELVPCGASTFRVARRTH